MAYLPVVLGFRFILEGIGLYAFGLWGWMHAPGFLRVVLAIGLPSLAAYLWSTFQAIEPVEPKPIRHVVPGRVRLALELGLFALAVLALLDSGRLIGGAIFGVAILLYHLLSLDRISWLLKPG